MLTVLAATLVASPIRAQTPSGTQARSATGGSPVSDALFAEAAAISGLAEVTMSEIGYQQATDQELKRFSQQMIDEHNRLNQELTTLATQKRIPLPRTVDPRAQFCAQSLKGTSRDKFDRCYAKAQLVAHMEAVSAFEAESERGQDADMRALAATALPRIKSHLQMIKPIAKRYEQQEETSETQKTVR